MEPTTTSSYSKLQSGAWGIRVMSAGAVKPGDYVDVHRKDGKVNVERLGNLVWEGNGVQLYAIDKNAPDEEVAF